jgi:hypothetical protein
MPDSGAHSRRYENVEIDLRRQRRHFGRSGLKAGMAPVLAQVWAEAQP